MFALFAVACSDDPTAAEPGKFAADPQFNMSSGGGNHGSPTYDYTFSGEVTTYPSFGVAGGGSGGGDADQVDLDGCCDATEETETLMLSETLLGHFGPDHEKCFRADKYDFSGSMKRDELDKKDTGRVTATFFFTALGSDGMSEFNYVLTLEGTVDGTTDDGIFPPEPAERTTVTFDHATMKTEGNGQGGNACISGEVIGEANVGTSVLLEGLEGMN